MRRMQELALAAALLAAGSSYADISGTTATVRPNNSLIVDIQVTTTGGAAKVAVTYQTAGVEPLVSRFTPVSTTGPTTITIGSLRANRTYTYIVRATARITVGADKAYDTADFVGECRNMNVTPHVAQNDKRPGGSAIDGRTTRHAGYAISQKKRKRIEECFGWLKTIALMRKVRHRGIFQVGWVFTFAAAAYNLVRMRNLRTSSVGAA